LDPKSKKPEGFRSSGFCCRWRDQSTIRAATPRYRKGLLCDANHCGPGICTDGKANGRRQIPTHCVAAMGYRANPVCEYLCLHQCLVPKIDQTLSIDLGKNVSAESIGNGKQAVVGFDQRSWRADQRSSQTPPRAGM